MTPTPRTPGTGPEAAHPRGRYAPGSLAESRAILTVAAVASAVVLYLADGVAAAATGLALIAAVGLLMARFVVGIGARDSDHRRKVRLLGSRAPGLGEWQRIVDKSLSEEEGDFHFATTLRPQLQRLFAARLAQRHGVDLHRSPDRARALVGPGLWPWLDPAAPPPAPRLPEPELRALLDRLDAL